MAARSPKKIKKAHALRKRVKLEKQRVRKMHKERKHAVKMIKAAPRVHVRLDAEAKEALYSYCFRHNVKPYKAIKQILRVMMDRDETLIKEKLSKETTEGLLSGIQA